MYGAILGDIIGSPFEFDRGEKTKDFDLFTKGCGFTDDSVMTVTATMQGDGLGAGFGYCNKSVRALSAYG